MFYVLTTLHVLVCLFLIGVVLLQSGKAADLAGAFGGMGSQTAFGPRGSATLLSKLTTGSAIIFMLTSLTLSIMATRDSGAGGKSVIDSLPPQTSAPSTTTTLPVPGQPAAQPPAQTPVQQPQVQIFDERTGKPLGAPQKLDIPPNPAQQKQGATPKK